MDAVSSPPTRIGVFDSGVGGLSVLTALRRHLPWAELQYVADSAFAPYGERRREEIVDRAQRIADHFVAHGVDAIVVACNTATAAAIDQLRAEHGATPFIGVEPGVKPGASVTRNGRVGVLATQATLSSDRFRTLVEAQRADVRFHLRACPGLAAAIERGDVDDPEIVGLVAQHCAPLRAAGVDTVVLGCTHYDFVRHHVQAAMGAHVEIIETAEAIAHQTRRVCAASASASRVSDRPRVVIRTTGDAQRLGEIAARWLTFDHEVRAAPVVTDSGRLTPPSNICG